MEPSILIGLVIGLAAVAGTVTLEGGQLSSLLNVPAALIVFGGTLSAAVVSFPLPLVFSLPKLIVSSLARPPEQSLELIEQVAGFADRARREGLLALEEAGQQLADPFLRNGVMLIVDGNDPEEVRSILEIEVAAMAERHAAGYGLLEALGGFAPTMGIIGTVLGLINVLGTISDPDGLGPAIAVAFIATLYGVASANLIWLPIAAKLKGKSKREIALRELLIEGVLAIQDGDNPRMVREKLLAFLSPAQRIDHAARNRPADVPADRTAAAGAD